MSEEIHRNGEFYKNNRSAKSTNTSYLSLFREISRHWSKLGNVSALELFNYGTHCSTICLLVLTSIYRILFDYKFHLIIVKLIMSVLIYLFSFGIIEIISALTETTTPSASGSSKSPSSLSSSIEVIEENDEYTNNDLVKIGKPGFQTSSEASHSSFGYTLSNPKF